jgi:predicted anti-sigma-YlaC factor YlaD
MTDQPHLSEETVQRYVDGTVAGERRGEILLHLEECARCRQAVRGQEFLDAALRLAVPRVAPERLREAVMREARLSRQFAATARIAAVLSVALPGVATLGVLAAIFWIGTTWKPNIPPGPLSTAAHQLSAWMDLARGGISTFFGSLTSAVFGAQQLAATLFAVGIAFTGVVLIDRLVGKRLLRR